MYLQPLYMTLTTTTITEVSIVKVLGQWLPVHTENCLHRQLNHKQRLYSARWLSSKPVCAKKGAKKPTQCWLRAFYSQVQTMWLHPLPLPHPFWWHRAYLHTMCSAISQVQSWMMLKALNVWAVLCYLPPPPPQIYSKSQATPPVTPI